ncbi:hypothetical protein HK405_005195, partial [Cladochytrium tenue]
FLDQLFHDGHMYLNFDTSYDKEHQPLEDFQLHRMVVGVIGIAIDDIRGLKIVPNEGHLSLNLSNIINTFASDLLVAFASMAFQIERRPLIAGPSLNAAVQYAPSAIQTSSSSVSTPISQPPPIYGQYSQPTPSDPGNSFGTLGSLLTNDRNKKRTPARAQKLIGDVLLMAGRLDLAMSTYLSALDILKQTADFNWHGAILESYYSALALTLLNKVGLGPKAHTVTLSGNTDRPTQVMWYPPTLTSVLGSSSSALSAGPLRAFLCDLPDRYREIISLYDRGSAAGPTAPGFCPLLAPQASMRMAWLLVGMWKHRFDGTVTNGAGILMLPPDRPGHGAPGVAAAAGTLGSNEYGPGGGPGSGASGGGTGGAAAAADGERIVLNGGAGVSRLDVASWVSRARASPYFDHLSLPDQVGLLALMAAACGTAGLRRKHALFLRIICRLVAGSLRPIPPPAPPRGASAAGGASAPGPLEMWRSALSTASLASLASEEDGEGEDGTAAVSREMQLLTESSSPTGRADTRPKGRETNGALECLKRVCDVLGVSWKQNRHASSNSKSWSDDEDEFLDEFEEEGDIDSALSGNIQNGGKRAASQRIRFGWPGLQVDALKECVIVCQAVDDHSNTIYFLSLLLRRMRRHLSRQEQQDLGHTLQAVVLRTSAIVGSSLPPSAAGTDPRNAAPRATDINGVGPDLPVLLRAPGGVNGLPVLRRVDVVRPSNRRMVSRHAASELSSPSGALPTAVRRLFIVDQAGPASAARPSRKAHGNVSIVSGDDMYFDVVLANPCAFDLEVQTIEIVTTGVPFVASPASAIVLAETRCFPLRLTGKATLPEGDDVAAAATATLLVHGCRVRLFGGCVEQDLFPVQAAVEDPRRKDSLTKDGRRKPQRESERLGKPPHPLPPRGSGKERNWSIPVKVVPPQPLLQPVDGVQNLPLGSLMVFEEERTSFTIELENAGTAPANHILVSFKERASPDAPAPPPASDSFSETPEDMFERDVLGRYTAAFVLAEPGAGAGGRALGFPISPYPGRPTKLDEIVVQGGRLSLRVNCFGKRWCNGCDIVVEYGHVPESIMPENTEAHADGAFFTRQLVIPIVMTVQKALEVLNLSVLSLPPLPFLTKGTTISDQKIATKSPPGPVLKDASRALSVADMIAEAGATPGLLAETDGVGSNLATAEYAAGLDGNDWCLLTFDVRNSWNLPFEVTFRSYGDSNGDDANTTLATLLQANMTKRIILPVRRLELPTSLTVQPIPMPRDRQVVQSRLRRPENAEADQQRRLAFWLREALFGGMARSLSDEGGDDVITASWLLAHGLRRGAGLFGEAERLRVQEREQRDDERQRAWAAGRAAAAWSGGRVDAAWAAGRGRAGGLTAALRDALRLESAAAPAELAATRLLDEELASELMAESVTAEVRVRALAAKKSGGAADTGAAEDKDGILEPVGPSRWKVRAGQVVQLEWILRNRTGEYEPIHACFRMEPVQQLHTGLHRDLTAAPPSVDGESVGGLRGVFESARRSRETDGGADLERRQQTANSPVQQMLAAAAADTQQYAGPVLHAGTLSTALKPLPPRHPAVDGSGGAGEAGEEAVTHAVRLCFPWRGTFRVAAHLEEVGWAVRPEGGVAGEVAGGSGGWQAAAEAAERRRGAWWRGKADAPRDWVREGWVAPRRLHAAGGVRWLQAAASADGGEEKGTGTGGGGGIVVVEVE